MEISGKVLREVEFRDRLRGYDTDEVDEFLENVAVGVDDLLDQLVAAQQRAERAEQQMLAIPPMDDDSLRRTLVLAQRTADLAISEAREEAQRVLDQARAQADATLAEARQVANSMRSDAERELERRVAALGEEHDRLTRQIQVLVSLVEGERSRLLESLQGLLGYVSETLGVSPQVAEGASFPGLSAPAPYFEATPYAEQPYAEPYGTQPAEEPYAAPAEEQTGMFQQVPVEEGFGASRAADPLGLDLPDVEAEIADDADFAFGSARSSATGGQGEVDPDEELWTRWANSADQGEHREGEEPFRFGQRPDDSA
jgi:DivIVA domain-containing protein